MTVYVVAQLKIHDRQTYDKYQAAFWPTFKGIEGSVLAGDEAPSVEEGVWGFDKIVLLSFKDKENYQKWLTSDAYQAIVGDRRAGAEGPILLVQGLN